MLNVDKGYVRRPEDIVWTVGVAEAIRRANAADLLVVVVTNQSGVARGYYDETDVDALHVLMGRRLREQGARIDRFYYCPFHEAVLVAAYRSADHPDRKPSPGMLLRAINEMSIWSARSFLIGDQASDLAAAERAGIVGHLFEGGDLAALTGRAIAELPSNRSISRANCKTAATDGA